MKWLGPILLIGVFVRHDTANWLPWYSSTEWFYIMGGLWEVILCGIILLILPAQPLVMAALWIGILEGSQVMVCGALMGHQRPPAGMNECDYLTGLPIGATMTALYLMVVCCAIGKEWRAR